MTRDCLVFYRVIQLACRKALGLEWTLDILFLKIFCHSSKWLSLEFSRSYLNNVKMYKTGKLSSINKHI